MITGESTSVQVITDADLKANGGSYELQAGPALPVAVVADTGGITGPSLIVYVKNTGERIAGPAIQIRNDTGSGKERVAGPAIPVRVVSGAL